MNRIDEIIERLCPDGVPVKALGDIARLVRGNGMPKTVLTEHGVGAIHYGQIYTQYGVWAEKTISFVSPETASKLSKADPGDIIITNTSENLEDVGKAVAWLGSRQIVTGGHATIIKHSQEPKFLAYWFQSESFALQKKALATGTKVIDISANKLLKIRLPVPPLEVQREIVRILDKFRELEAELEAELESRELQYAHYRTRLLRPTVATPIVLLGEIAEFKYGLTDKAAEVGSHRFLRITDITASGKLSPNGAKFVDAGKVSKDFVVQPGDILMARTGATFGKTMLVDSLEPAVFASFLIRVRFREQTLIPEYYWHFAQSAAYWDQANALVSTGGQPQFNANVLKTVRVPAPPIEVQKRIVETLNKFDALVNDLSVGLPAELAARRKQYEHYRDRLLTFKEAV